MGAWNPLQQLQVVQALQTLASLGVGNLGQHGRFQMLLIKYTGQDWKGSFSKAIAPPESTAIIPPSKDPVFGFDDHLEGLDVFIVGMNKKDWQAIQHKVHQAIVNKACKMAIKRKNKRLKPYFVTCDSLGKPKTPHRNIWVNMCEYYGILDPNIDSINAQPHALMNTVKTRLEDQWEYVGYELFYREFKAQMNVYLKNRWHSLKIFIEACEPRHKDCSEEHWESMKCLVTSKAKQGEAAKYHAMWALLATLSHSNQGGEVGAARKLVNYNFFDLFDYV